MVPVRILNCSASFFFPVTTNFGLCFSPGEIASGGFSWAHAVGDYRCCFIWRGVVVCVVRGDKSMVNAPAHHNRTEFVLKRIDQNGSDGSTA